MKGNLSKGYPFVLCARQGAFKFIRSSLPHRELPVIIIFMGSWRWIIIMPFLWWALDARAQLPAQASAVTESWQLTLDVIKAQARTLMIKNNGLQGEYQRLAGQVQKLDQQISDRQHQNEKLSRYLKERHGRSDQQVRIEQLKQGIKIKQQQLGTFEQRSQNLRRKQADLQRKVRLEKLTVAQAQLRGEAQKQQARASEDEDFSKADQLARVRRQLEDENKQEVLLENELKALKTGDQGQGPHADAIEQENKKLQARLDVLRLQKQRYDQRSPDAALARANRHRYDELKKRKDELEADIGAYEERMDQLRESSATGLSWPEKKKKLIHAMVQTDARNNQIRGKIKVLREDIDVLRDQVAKFERRAAFVQGKGPQP